MPDVIARLRPDGLTLLIAAIALLGAGLALARVAVWGPALHWDSVNYIEVARALLAGDGFTQPDWYLFRADAYATWPPLYPMLLAGGGLGAADPYDVAGPLSAVSFGLTIFVAGRWMARRLESPVLVAWACCALALSVPLSRAASAALAEAPFILLTTLTLVQADAFARDGRRSALLWAVAFAALACLTRYLGVALIVVVALAPFLRGGVPLGARMRLAATGALMAALPLALWMLRTALLTGNAARAANEAVASPPHETLGRALEVLSRWLLPYVPLERFQDAASALVGALLLLLAFLAVRAFRDASETAPAKTALLLALFGVGYVLALAAGRAWSEGSDELRYFFPLYAPAVLLAATLCAPVIRGLTLPPLRPGFAAFVSAAVALALVAWLALHVSQWAREVHRESVIDVDAREPLWSVPFLQSIHAIELGETVLSNGPAVLETYFGGGREYRLLEYDRADAAARIRAAPPGASVVWFHDLAVSVRYGYDARDLRGLPALETVAERADGVVFVVGDGGANGWRRLAEAVAGAEPAASAFYDLHLIDGALVYVRAPCERADMGRRVFLHVFPSNANDLPAERRKHGFDNLDFTLSRTGAYFEGTCIARAELPRYAIDRIHTGQFNNTGERWRAEFPFPDG